MPMEFSRHEEILNLLNNPETPVSERTELLSELRADYGTVLSDFKEHVETIEKLNAENSDLVLSNSKLFRKIGLESQGAEEEKKIKDKTLSETITLEDIERGTVK